MVTLEVAVVVDVAPLEYEVANIRIIGCDDPHAAAMYGAALNPDIQSLVVSAQDLKSLE